LGICFTLSLGPGSVGVASRTDRAVPVALEAEIAQHVIGEALYAPGGPAVDDRGAKRAD
jgi:hypothetical protein